MRPRCTVLPRLVEREDGNVVVIPSEAGYSITEEPRGGVRVR